jgi:hypothetical protein
VHAVHEIISRGLANVVEFSSREDSIKLPAWVVSRLKQDNPDLSQAIVEMVIWVDRVKCWMYQADADLEKVIGEIDGAGHDAASGAKRKETASENKKSEQENAADSAGGSGSDSGTSGTTGGGKHPGGRAPRAQRSSIEF